MERRMKMPINVDPGVHSSFNLDQLVPGTPLTPIPTVPTLPTIAEVKVQEQSGSSGASSAGSTTELRNPRKNPRIVEIKEGAKYEKARDDSDKNDSEFTQTKPSIPRNASQPAFTTHHQGLPKNGSVPFFDRMRKSSVSERFKPTLGAIKSTSKGNMNSNGDLRKSLHLRLSNASFMGSRNNNSDDPMVRQMRS